MFPGCEKALDSTMQVLTRDSSFPIKFSEALFKLDANIDFPIDFVAEWLHDEWRFSDFTVLTNMALDSQT